ncbi:MAG: hypothetical protein ACLTX3_08595 [Lachnospiraceae bacterium]
MRLTVDCFIIINEGNGQATEALDPEKINHADEICKESCLERRSRKTYARN